ncbi:DUF3696 domain-containing protein [Nostoc sp. FACHB-892]|uniref:DUF3696 domain-containing protein n=1 Tax=Nostoc sp. FACHB-892 TaxID=2692843 RepID=UPI001F5521CA|nr:DUF3696 domain-containing protein [Nostoc sp. FACHB-892]
MIPESTNSLINASQDYERVISPRIDKDGRIDRWTDGFFDEWENSLIVLLEPAKS